MKVSPTLYPVPPAFTEVVVITPFDTATLIVKPDPLPVKLIVLTALVLEKSYPLPPPAVEADVAIEPCPSMIPVTL